jgi:hypothetical protein
MTARRHLGLIFGFLALFTAVSPSNGAGISEQPSSAVLEGGWHFVRTRSPSGGADAISIMHTADTSRSDLDLAGLMIRCGGNGAEIVVILLRSFPVRARPLVVFGRPGKQSQFEATVAPPGTALLISRDATSLVDGPWRPLNDLFIRIEDGKFTIRGVVAIAGLQSAFKLLIASCHAL